MSTFTRRSFVKRSSAVGSGVVGMGALQAYGAQVAAGQAPGTSTGYGSLVVKSAQNDPAQQLMLPAAFNFAVVDRQGLPMDNGDPTPGIFDGTGSYPTKDPDVTILIRNHENRRRGGEIPAVVPTELRYDSDPSYVAGDTKLVVRRTQTATDPDGTPRYSYQVERIFAILGGTDTNCAGGVVGDQWYTCEEVVNRSAVSGRKHGYNFAIPAYADGPVKAVALPQQGRMSHEAVAELDGILYETEDRRIQADTAAPAATGTPDRKPLLGACFYRFVPDGKRGADDGGSRRRRSGGFEGDGTLQALKLVDEFHANMDVERTVGTPYRVEWVDIDVPDHDDDNDATLGLTALPPRTTISRAPGVTAVRVQAQDKGAAFFDREEGIWTAEAGRGRNENNGCSRGKVYFDCTEGGKANLGQVWEYDPRREVITLIFESTNPAQLQNPDNVVIVPRSGDVFLQEDGPLEQFVRGLTTEGEIYDFAQTVTNPSEFCGGCFDEDGMTFFVSQQGERGGTLESTPDKRAVTYAIYGPFEEREGLKRPGRRNGRGGKKD